MIINYFILSIKNRSMLLILKINNFQY